MSDELGRPFNLRCERVGRRRRRIRRRRGRLLGIGELIDDQTDDLAGSSIDELADLGELGLLDDLGDDDMDDDDLAEIGGLGLLLMTADRIFIGAEQFSDPEARELARKRRQVRRLRSLLRRRTGQVNNAKRAAIKAQRRIGGQPRSLIAKPAGGG